VFDLDNTSMWMLQHTAQVFASSLFVTWHYQTVDCWKCTTSYSSWSFNFFKCLGISAFCVADVPRVIYVKDDYIMKPLVGLGLFHSGKSTSHIWHGGHYVEAIVSKYCIKHPECQELLVFISSILGTISIQCRIPYLILIILQLPYALRCLHVLVGQVESRLPNFLALFHDMTDRMLRSFKDVMSLIQLFWTVITVFKLYIS